MRVMFDEVRGNRFRSWLLCSFFIVLIGVLGAVIGLVYGNIFFGLIVALIFGFLYSLIGFYSGDSMILSMSGASAECLCDWQGPKTCCNNGDNGPPEDHEPPGARGCGCP